MDDKLLPSHNEKTLNAMKAPRTVKRITFNPSKANPGETLYVYVPKLNENEVIVPNSLALITGARREACCKVCGHRS